MSVAVASLLRADSRGVSSVAPNTVDFAVFAWRVGALRERGFDVIHAPVEGEPAHANVVKVDEGDEPEKPWSRGARRALIEAGSWAIAPSHRATERPN